MIKYPDIYTPTPFTPEQKEEIPLQTPYGSVVLEKMNEYIQRCSKLRLYETTTNEDDEERAKRQFDTLTKIATLHVINNYLSGKARGALDISDINSILLTELKGKMYPKDYQKLIDHEDIKKLNQLMLEALRVVKDYYLTGGKNVHKPEQEN